MASCLWLIICGTEQQSQRKMIYTPTLLEITDGKWFLSIEPIHEELGIFGTNGLNIPHWVIIGAETGNRKDKVIPKREWIESIVNQCRTYRIPVFMKSSLAEIWGEELIQEFPPELRHE